METLKQYKAADGKIFDDRFECARHEFRAQPGLLNKLADEFGGPYPHTLQEQKRWCGGDPETSSGGYACGCMGCANHTFYKLGLQYEHWKVWIDELRGPQPYDSVPSSMDDVDVILVSAGPDRIKVYNHIRESTGLGVIEAKKLLDTPNAVLKRSASFYSGRTLAEAINQAGGEAKIEVARPDWDALVKAVVGPRAK